MVTKSRTLEKTFAARVAELKSEKGYTIEKFAGAFDAKPNTVRDWLNARVLPRTEALHAIASHFGVTTDWLLGIEGAPKHPTQWRTAEENVSARVRHEALASVPKLPANLRDRITVDGDAVLRMAADQAAAEVLEIVRWYSYRHHAGVTRARLKKLDDPRMLEILAPFLKNVVEQTRPKLRLTQFADDALPELWEALFSELDVNYPTPPAEPTTKPRKRPSKRKRS